MKVGRIMEKEKAILHICVNHKNCQLDPADCIYAIETTTYGDAAENKRTFIPGNKCDK